MYKLSLFVSFLFMWWFCPEGFGQGGASSGGSEYKGKPEHVQPDIAVFPDQAQYEFTKLLPEEIRAKLGDKIRSMVEKLHITGITATILVPGKGIWGQGR